MNGVRSRACAVLCAVALAAGTLLAAAVIPAAAAGPPTTIIVTAANDRVEQLSNNWGDGSGNGTATLTVDRGGNPAFGPVTAPISNFGFSFNLAPGNVPAFDVQTGDVVTVDDDSGNSAAMTVLAIAVTNVDIGTKTVSGTGPANNPIEVVATAPDNSSNCTKQVNSDGSGSWSAIFDDCNPVIPFVRPNQSLGIQGTFGGANAVDGNDNYSAVGWSLPAVRTIQVILTADRVWSHSNDWGDGNGSGTATLTIERGGNPAYGPVTEAIGGGEFRFSLFPGNGGPYEFDVQPGDVVTVNDDSGNSATTTVVDLAVSAADAGTRTVSGTVVPDSQVQVGANTPGGSCLKDVASNSGSWSVTFDDCNPDITFEAGNTFGAASVADGDGNTTFVDWNVPPTAQLFVNGRFNGIEGWNFSPGATADIQIFQQFNDPSPIIQESEPTDGNGNFSHYFGSFDITPGMWVVVTDGTNTKDAVVSELEVWGSNPTLGTVYGHAAPGSTVTVKTIDQSGGCYRNVVAGGNGNWTVDFTTESQPGDCTVPLPWDVPTRSPGAQVGVQGDAFQSDGDGDWTGHELWNPSWIDVSAFADRVEGIGSSFRVGANATITIDDPGTAPSPDVTVNTTVSSGWPDQFHLCTSQGIQVGQFGCTVLGGPIDIKPGFVVTVDDGITHKSTVVTGVTVTNVNGEASTVSGTADPYSSVLVDAFGDPFGNPGQGRSVVADGQGNWFADFSVAQGSDGPFLFGPNQIGVALQTELTGTIDGDETNYFWSAATGFDVFPSFNLVDGQAITVSGQNWPPNKTFTMNECVLGVPFSGTTCDLTTQQQLTTDANGNVSGVYHVVRNITTQDTGPVNCAVVPNSCGLVGFVWHDRVGHPEDGISIDGPGNHPLAFAAYLDVTPNTNLVEGQTVTIDAAGWPANKPLFMTECALGFGLSEQTCDGSTQQQLQTGNDGTASGQFRVSRTIVTVATQGQWDCAAAPNRCGIVGVVWHGEVGNVGQGLTLDFPENNPLAFAPNADHTPPTVSISAPAEGAKIAEHKLLKASYACSDTGGSGLASCVGDVAKGSPINTTVLGLHTFTVTARDRAGNLTVVTRHYTVIDVSAPLVVLNIPTTGATFSKGSIVNANYVCFDAGSGIASCLGTAPNGSPIDTSSLGTKTFTVTAIDIAGNKTKVTASYKVGYLWNGFVGLLDPPTANPAGVTAGQKLPVVFDLGGAQGLPVTTAAKSTQVTCGTNTLVGASAAATGAVSYNSVSGKYTYLWTTKAAWAGTCRQFQITLKDGSIHQVNFHF